MSKRMNRYEIDSSIRILKIHRSNVADLRLIIAKNPDDLKAKRQLEDEAAAIEAEKQLLRDNGIDVEVAISTSP